ncbi:MAG: YceD family protein [Tangfeifania sp.]
MGWRTKYDIEFKGLKEGLHEFEFKIEDTFFEHFDQELVSHGDLDVKVELEKRNTFMKLYFDINGWLELTCDRCLDNYRQPINQQNELFVKFDENNYEDDDEVMWLFPEEHNINLAHLIYEYIVLGIPLKHVHPDKKKGESGCNIQMIERLENHVPHEKEEKEEQDIDPRWEALKKLKNNN